VINGLRRWSDDGCSAAKASGGSVSPLEKHAVWLSAMIAELRSNDLIWSKLTRDYLMAERAQPSDLMVWNADATRLPYRMHSGNPPTR